MVLKSMKKMSVLFWIFTVMLPSISWGGVADGKSIICHCINCSLTTEERGWAFLDGKVTYVFPSTYKDEVTIKEEIIPMIKEIEKPLIGPKPKAKRNIAANNVVKFESSIVT